MAQGKIQPTGRVKTIQPLETGRVVAIHVENGQHVKAGEVLVELDPAEAVADEQASLSALASYKAERLRRRAALAAAESTLDSKTPKIAWPEDIPQAIREREQRVLEGDLGQLRVSAQSYDAQIAQKKDEEHRLENTVQAEQALIDTLQQRVAMRKGLLARGSTPKAAVLDAMETLQTQETQLAMQRGQLLEARAAQRVLEQERQKTIETFIAENGQKLERGRTPNRRSGAKVRQGACEDRPYDAREPDLRHCAGALGHDEKSGADDERRIDAHRPGRRRIGD